MYIPVDRVSFSCGNVRIVFSYCLSGTALNRTLFLSEQIQNITPRNGRLHRGTLCNYIFIFLTDSQGPSRFESVHMGSKSPAAFCSMPCDSGKFVDSSTEESILEDGGQQGTPSGVCGRRTLFVWA